MRDHSKHIQVNKFEAVDIIIKHCSFINETEILPVQESFGRVLAEDVLSKWDSPNCLTCRMDSVAVHWDDFANGMPDTSHWIKGKDWDFANTGVAMPSGFDTAIVVEHVLFSENDSKISFDALPSCKYAGTSSPGSKLKIGDILVKKGTTVTPLLAASIISGMNAYVKVYRKPIVGFIPTGNELVSCPGIIQNSSDICSDEKQNASTSVPIGKNIESNSSMIAEKIKSWGGIPVVYGIVPDVKEDLKAALIKASEECDIVVLNAGSSKGNDDWGIEMLEELGSVLYHQTNHGPGHHSSFGVLNNKPVVGISGPPGGAAFTTDYYLYPAMMVCEGKEPQLKSIKVRLASDIPEAFKFVKKTPEIMGINAENRPAETGEFYSVKQMKLQIAEDGVIEAWSAGSSHPSPVEAELMDAYYLMPSCDSIMPPVKGDFITVELRP